jgi:integrase
MSCILKDSKNRSPYWIASFTAADGRRLKRSTKTTDRELAKQTAAKWEALGKAGRAGRLVESQCRKVIADLYEQATGSALVFPTARSWLTDWIEEKKVGVSPRTKLKYEQVVREFLEHLKEKADAPINAIVDGDLISFRNSLARAGHSASTVNGAMKILRSPFHLAHRKGYITADPCVGVGLLDDDIDIEKDVFTPEQIGALIAEAEGDWKGAILCGYYTGLRLRDVSELRWEAVDAGLTKLELVPQKTRRKKKNRKIVLPIHPQFAAWLKKQPRGIGKAPVFPSLAGKSGGGKSGLSMMFKRIMERAGIAGRILRERNGEGRSQSSLSFHSLRHSFNSALANVDVPQEIRMALTGHGTVEMNRLYTHGEIDRLRRAVDKLPDIVPMLSTAAKIAKEAAALRKFGIPPKKAKLKARLMHLPVVKIEPMPVRKSAKLPRIR